MIRNKTYLFTFYAARDSGYAFNTEAKKKQSLKLYIFGSEANCGFGELLAPPFKISNSKWTKYSMPIKASKANWTHMVIYAALDSATDEKEKASESFLLFNQQEMCIRDRAYILTQHGKPPKALVAGNIARCV